MVVEIRGVSLKGMKFQSDFLCLTPVNEVAAYSHVWEAIIKEIATDSAGSPLHMPKLTDMNDLEVGTATGNPYYEPQRILFRRFGYLGVGRGTSLTPMPPVTPISYSNNWGPVRRPMRAYLRENEALYHWVGFANPTSETINIVCSLWAAVAYAVYKA